MLRKYRSIRKGCDEEEKNYENNGLLSWTVTNCNDDARTKRRFFNFGLWLELNKNHNISFLQQKMTNLSLQTIDWQVCHNESLGATNTKLCNGIGPPSFTPELIGGGGVLSLSPFSSKNTQLTQPKVETQTFVQKNRHQVKRYWPRGKDFLNI